MDFTRYLGDIRKLAFIKRVDFEKPIDYAAALTINRILDQMEEEVIWAKLYNRMTINHILKSRLMKKPS